MLNPNQPTRPVGSRSGSRRLTTAGVEPPGMTFRDRGLRARNVLAAVVLFRFGAEDADRTDKKNKWESHKHLQTFTNIYKSVET